MGPSWQSGVQIGVAVMATCIALTVHLVLFATRPRGRWLWSGLNWAVGGFVAAVPFAAFGPLPWLPALLLGTGGGGVIWASIELRLRWTHWTYVEWPAKQKQAEDLRAYRPKSFSG